MKKYIEDMTREELREIFENNNSLRGKVWHNAVESVDFCVEEYLRGIGRAAEFSIGASGPNYITVRNVSAFLGWVQACHSDFGIFYDIESEKPGNVDKLCKKAKEINEKLNNGVCSKRDGCYYSLSDKDAERVEKRLDEIIELFTSYFLDLCRQEYDYFYDDENLFSYWLDEIYSGMSPWDEYYLDTDEGKYTLVRAYMQFDKLA